MSIFSSEEKQSLSTYQADTTSEAAKPANDLASVVGMGEPTPTAPASLVDSAVAPTPPQSEESLQPTDIDARLKSLARQIAGTKKKLVGNVLQIGEALTEAQDLLANHHGGAFGKWVKQSCGFSKRTAYNYMSAHLVFGGCATVAQRRFEPSTG